VSHLGITLSASSALSSLTISVAALSPAAPASIGGLPAARAPVAAALARRVFHPTVDPPGAVLRPWLHRALPPHRAIDEELPATAADAVESTERAAVAAIV